MKSVWLKIAVGIVLLIGTGYAYSAWRTHVQNRDTVRDEQLKELAKRDSTTAGRLATADSNVSRVAGLVVTGITHWDTVTRRVPVVHTVRVPGEVRVDSVYRDSAFAALADSDKVKLLVTLGNANNKVCTELVSACQAARDTARRLLVIKDSTIQLWHMRFDDKPRRRCGIGGAIGAIAGVSSTFQPISGFGVALGYSCSL